MRSLLDDSDIYSNQQYSRRYNRCYFIIYSLCLQTIYEKKMKQAILKKSTHKKKCLTLFNSNSIHTLFLTLSHMQTHFDASAADDL